MCKTILAGLLLAMSSVHAEQALNPQYDSNAAVQPQQYLNEAISLQLDTETNEGILAYANKVAHGDKVTVVSSPQGFAIFSQNDGQYQLVKEVRNAELGFELHQSIDKVYVSASDSWLLVKANRTIFSVPLDQDYQPVLTAMTQADIGYNNGINISKNLLAVNSNYNIATYTIAADTGSLTALQTLQLQDYAEHIALTDDILLIARSGWESTENNLYAYQLVNSQWQYVTGHQMTQEGSSYRSVDYLTVSPNGQRIIYGGNQTHYILALNLADAQFTQLDSGSDLFIDYFNELAFIDNDTLLIRNYNNLFLFGTDNQQLASLHLPDVANEVKDIMASAASVTLLSANGLVQLATDTLTVNATLAPGEQDIVLNFADPQNLIQLGDDYLLQRSESMFRLYKLNQQGMPELVQSSTPQQLLGHDYYYYSHFSSLELGDGLFGLFHDDRYSILQLDTENQQLQLLSTGTLTGRNGQYLSTSADRLVNVGDYLIVAAGDSLTLQRLGQNHQVSYVDAVVNGASGISGIAQIQLLMVAGQHIYTVDQQNQVISHFVINDNRLQQQQQYQQYAFPQVQNYYLRGNLLTLQSHNFLQSYRITETGELILLSNQYLAENISQWLPLGERFAAVKYWQGLQILEQDHNSGVWFNSLSISEQQLQQDYQLSHSLLLPLAGSLGIYDQQQKRLVRFSHNSAPYVADIARLQLMLNQGQAYQLALSSVFSDEEDATLQFSLQNAADSFSISNDNQLSFSGQQTTSGSLDVLAEDAAGLVSLASLDYQLNLAPVAKATVPVFSTVESDAIQFELAQHFIDPEGQALQFAFASAQNGLSLSSTGLLTGKLTSAGDTSLSFNISDSAGAVAVHTVTIKVTAKPKESSGGSLHWLLLSLLAGTALCRLTSKRL